MINKLKLEKKLMAEHWSKDAIDVVLKLTDNRDENYISDFKKRDSNFNIKSNKVNFLSRALENFNIHKNIMEELCNKASQQRYSTISFYYEKLIYDTTPRYVNGYEWDDEGHRADYKGDVKLIIDLTKTSHKLDVEFFGEIIKTSRIIPGAGINA